MATQIEAFNDVLTELRRAQSKHGPMRSGHEGYAVIHEELDELWDEVKKRHQDNAAMYLEAKQTAAMAIRFMMDVCE